MVTYAQTATLDNANPTDAKLQDFLTKWYAAFETGPMEQTADTGQFDEATMAWASMSMSSSAPSYQVHRLNDSLFSTAPIYVKTGWSNSGGYLKYSVGMGTGTDGAGNLTGLQYPLATITGSVSNVYDTTVTVIGSGGEGYASVFTDPAAVIANPYITAYHVGVFRTTDANDSPDARGALLTYYTNASSNSAVGMKFVAMDFAAGNYIDYGNYGFWQFGGSSASLNPSLRKEVSRVVIPYYGYTVTCPYLVGNYRDEFTYGSPFVASPNGNPHQYQHVKSIPYSGVNTNSQYSTMAVIWE